MTEREMHHKLLESIGWTDICNKRGNTYYGHTPHNSYQWFVIRQFDSSLIHECERVLLTKERDQRQYIAWILSRLPPEYGVTDLHYLIRHASVAMLAEALLKTIGKWEEQ